MKNRLYENNSLAMNNLIGKVEQRFSQHMSRNSLKNNRHRKSSMLAPGATAEISQRWRKSIDINCSSIKFKNEIKGMDKLEMER